MVSISSRYRFIIAGKSVENTHIYIYIHICTRVICKKYIYKYAQRRIRVIKRTYVCFTRVRVYVYRVAYRGARHVSRPWTGWFDDRSTRSFLFPRPSRQQWPIPHSRGVASTDFPKTNKMICWLCINTFAPAKQRIIPPVIGPEPFFPI